MAPTTGCASRRGRRRCRRPPPAPTTPAGSVWTGGGASRSGCMIRQVSSTPSWRVKRVLCPTIAAWSSTSYGVAPSPPSCGELHVEVDDLGPRRAGAPGVEEQPDPGRGVELDDQLVGFRVVVREAEPQLRRSFEHEPDLGLGRRQVLSRADEERNARPAPVVDVEAQGGVGLGRRVRGDAVGVEVALVLPADVVGGVGGSDGAEDRELRVLERLGVTPGGGLHGRDGDDLHDVVDDDVTQRADGVVEVAPVLDPEALGHRDLDAGEVVPVPDRLQHRVREPEVEELLEAHLPEEVIDPVDLRLVQVLVELGGERAGGGLVVTERLLDHHPGPVGETGFGRAPARRCRTGRAGSRGRRPAARRP